MAIRRAIGAEPGLVAFLRLRPEEKGVTCNATVPYSSGHLEKVEHQAESEVPPAMEGGDLKLVAALRRNAAT